MNLMSQFIPSVIWSKVPIDFFVASLDKSIKIRVTMRNFEGRRNRRGETVKRVRVRA